MVIIAYVSLVNSVGLRVPTWKMNGEHEPKRIKLSEEEREGDVEQEENAKNGMEENEEVEKQEEMENREIEILEMENEEVEILEMENEEIENEEIENQDIENQETENEEEDQEPQEKNSIDDETTAVDETSTDDETPTDDEKPGAEETKPMDEKMLVVKETSLASPSIPQKIDEPPNSKALPPPPKLLPIIHRRYVQPSSQIFKMDMDCFDEMFDYLSFQDLLSFGRTNKKLQSYVSDYYKRYFSHRNYEVQQDGIYADYALIPAFDPFITRLQIRFCSFQPLYNISSRIERFPMLKHITFLNMDLIEPNYDWIQNIFDKIESVHLRSCLPEFCNKCINLCANLKRMSIRHVVTRSFFDHEEFPWLSRHYPKLEHFELTLLREWPIDGLIGFLERNSNIRTFATSGQCLWVNRDQLLNSTVKLNILEVRMMEVYGVDMDEFGIAATRMQTICWLLYQLYEKGFYQRLHFYITDDDQINNIDDLASLYGFDKLCITNFKGSFSLKPLRLVKELVIIKGIEYIDLVHLADQCVKLERLYLGIRTIYEILPFVRTSPKLYEITLLPEFLNKFDIKIVISVLNREREKLPAARKLTIYAPDDIYLVTKRTTCNGNVNMNSVELRRGDFLNDFLDNEIQ